MKSTLLAESKSYLLYGKVGKHMAPRDAGMTLRKISSAYFSPVL